MSVRLDHGKDELRGGSRDQRDAVHRRHIGAPHHIHGRGSARHGRHLGRSAILDRTAAAASRQTGVSHGQARPFASPWRYAGARGQLSAALERMTDGDKQTRIFLRADKVVPYGELMEVMNLLRAAGFLKVALVGLEKSP